MSETYFTSIYNTAEIISGSFSVEELAKIKRAEWLHEEWHTMINQIRKNRTPLGKILMKHNE